MESQIIIVARNTQFRVALERVCSGQGCRIETTDNVATASEIAVHAPVCVLVADVTLQDVDDGVRLAKALHEQNPELKCFLMVDKVPSDGTRSAEDEPWLRLVQKPIRMLHFSAELVDTIARSKRGS